MRIYWHKLFCSLLDDYFAHTSFQVEPEVELSLKRQYLDVAIIALGSGEARSPAFVCDGFERMTGHNLLTFKSFRESLNGFCLSELMGYYVAYCKQKELYTDKERTDVQLFAVSGRRPAKLLRERPSGALKPGVFRVIGFDKDVTLIVPNLVKINPRNAFWLMFSSDPKRVAFASEHYRLKQPANKGIINQVVSSYAKGAPMFDMKAFQQKCLDDLIAQMPMEMRLKDVPVEARLKGLSAEQIRAYLDKLESCD